MKNVIVVPCYNEENRLNITRFGNFLANNNKYSICFVNDGSSDSTIEMLKEFQNQHPDNCTVLDLKVNQGKAEAVRAGVNFSIKSKEVESVGYLDADLATDFEDYDILASKLQDPLNNRLCVFGSRKLDDQSDIKRSLMRDFASKIVGILIRFILKMPIKDTQCGAKVFSSQLAKQIFSKSFKSKWLFDIELFIRIKNMYANRAFNKLEEVALQRWVEVGDSKITLSESLKMPGQLFSIFFHYNIYPMFELFIDMVTKTSFSILTSQENIMYETSFSSNMKSGKA